MRYIHLLIMFGLVFICSCSNNQRLKKEIVTMQSKTINLCLDSMACVYNKNDAQGAEHNHSSFKIVYYIDLPECSSCILMKKNKDWENLLDSITSCRNKLQACFILHPVAFNMDAFRFAVKASAITVPVYVDTAGVFMRNNPHISDNPILHTFIIDEENRAVLLGDPVGNSQMQQLLIDILNR